MARKNHFLGALAVAAGILAAVGMLVLMTLVVKVGPARAQEGPNFAFSLAYAGTGSGPSGTGPGPGESRDIQVLLNYECPVGSGSFGCTSWRAIGLPYMPNSVPNLGPAWSPNGSRIAFMSNRPGNNEIYTMRSDGTGVVRLTNNQVNDSSPDWSPAGTKIAFSSDRSGISENNFEIYTMNADGSGIRRDLKHRSVRLLT
jgi:hypothetical protein